MRTGILGGTFNPPHLGHLHAAELAHDALRLDRVLFIPTNLPPHKALPENTASPEARCEMVRRLTADRPWAQLDTLEIDRGGASYTVDTLRALHGRGETDLYLIIGTDMLLSFDRSWTRSRVWRRSPCAHGKTRTGTRCAKRRRSCAKRWARGSSSSRATVSRSPRPSCGRAAICTASPRLRSRIISSGSTFTGFRATEKRGA